MKFLAVTATAAFAGLAASEASELPATVYLLRPTANSENTVRTQSIPQIPRQVARQVLLQRLGDKHGSILDDLPSGYDAERVVAEMNEFGVQPAPLFMLQQDSSARTGAAASQLVVMLEGVTAENAEPIRHALSEAAHAPAFVIHDPPSAPANSHLVDADFQAAGAAHSKCDLASTIDPFNSECWAGLSSVVKYDLRKSPSVAADLIDNLSQLLKFVESKDLETALVLLPESSRNSKHAHWTTHSPSELRRRGLESVLTGKPTGAKQGGSSSSSSSSSGKATKASYAPSDPSSFVVDAKLAASIPSCFQSESTCMSVTNGCSGHGQCLNKYGNDSSAACFVCHCFSTLNHPEDEDRPRSTTKWAGNMCQKKDISVPFWLLVGFTIALVGSISFAIGLLFSVGEEKLPGVIGAGVSRSK